MADAKKLQFTLNFKATGADVINKNIQALNDFAKSTKDLLTASNLLSGAMNQQTAEEKAAAEAKKALIEQQKAEKKALEDAAKAAAKKAADDKKIADDAAKAATKAQQDAAKTAAAAQKAADDAAKAAQAQAKAQQDAANKAAKAAQDAAKAQAKAAQDAQKAQEQADKSAIEAIKNKIKLNNTNAELDGKSKKNLKDNIKQYDELIKKLKETGASELEVKEAELEKKKYVEDTNKALKEQSNSFKDAAKSAAAIGIGAVIAGLTAAIAFAKEATDHFNELMQISKQTNLSFEYLQAASTVLKNSNVDIGAFADNLSELNKKILEGVNTGQGTAIDFFKQLNLDVEDFKNLKPEDQLQKIIDKMNEMNLSSDQQKHILGELGGDELFTVIDQLDAIKKRSDELKEKGLIISPSEQENMNALNDSITETMDNLTAFVGIITATVAPALKLLFGDEADDRDIINREQAQELSKTILTIISAIKQGVIYFKLFAAVIKASWNTAVGDISVGNMEIVNNIKKMGIDIKAFIDSFKGFNLGQAVREMAQTAFEEVQKFLLSVLNKILETVQKLASNIPFIGDGLAAQIDKARKALAEKSYEAERQAAARRENDVYRNEREKAKKEADEAAKKEKAKLDEDLAYKVETNRVTNKAILKDLKDTVAEQLKEQDKLNNFNSDTYLREQTEENYKKDEKARQEAEKKNQVLEAQSKLEKEALEIQKQIELVQQRNTLGKIGDVESLKQIIVLTKQYVDKLKEAGKEEKDTNEAIIKAQDLVKKYQDDIQKKQDEAVKKAKEASDKALQAVKDEIRVNDIQGALDDKRTEAYNKNLAVYDKLIAKAIELKRTEVEIKELQQSKLDYIKKYNDEQTKLVEEQKKKTEEQLKKDQENAKIISDLEKQRLIQQNKRLEVLKLESAERRAQIELIKDEATRRKALEIFDQVEKVNMLKGQLDILKTEIDELANKRLDLDISDTDTRLKIEQQIADKKKEQGVIMDQLGLKQDEQNKKLSFTVRDFEGLINNVYSNLGNLVADSITGAKTFDEAWREAAANVLKYLIQVMQQMLVMKALSAFGFGGGGFASAIGSSVGSAQLTYHSGGTATAGESGLGVFQNFGGLKKDEFNAVLQKGEAVLTQRQQENVASALQDGGNTGSATINNHIMIDGDSLAKSVSQSANFDSGVMKVIKDNRDTIQNLI